MHRIGQKKQVRVFRLITENTVDERIVQRAESKVRIDEMLIEQGRSGDREAVAEQRGILRDIIRFGADDILSDKASDTIDIDIDKILRSGTSSAAAVAPASDTSSEGSGFGVLIGGFSGELAADNRTSEGLVDAVPSGVAFDSLRTNISLAVSFSLSIWLNVYLSFSSFRF